MSWFERRWYGRPGLLGLLAPLEKLFGLISNRRRQAYLDGREPAWQAPVPVLVVGNISVGGTGKTPLVVWLVERLQSAGVRVGVISRGYGGKAERYPLRVTIDSSPLSCGDEPLLIVRRTGCPLAVSPIRQDAARLLLENEPLDLLISDDGLQHYALRRQIEIAVIDGVRGVGNGHLLPVGPLREPVSRLQEVDLRVVNGGDYVPKGLACHRMRLTPGLLALACGAAGQVPPTGGRVHAVAGIGNPQRFFDTLRLLGFEVVEHAFGDHHQFQPQDLQFSSSHPIIMTEKDAVKCSHFAVDDCWYLPVEASMPEAFERELERLLAGCCPSFKGFRSHG